MWLHNLSDGLIFLSYLSIPVILIWFVLKRRDLPFPWLFAMFGCFIVFCGAGHLTDILMTVHPMYRFSGLVKASTALISVVTAVALIPLVPQALALRSPRELEILNRKLLAEIEERRRAEASLAEMNRQLRESERLKDEFIANVSHELRTPLTLVLGPLETLLASPEASLPPDVRASLRTMHNNAVRLLQMVTGLLDASRLEAGKAELRREPTDLAALTRSIFADFEPLLVQRRIQASLRLDLPAAPLAMDRYLYERILFNLLSNAAKFTPEGGRVEAAASWREGRLALSVADTGIGIAEADQGTLFRKFRQVEGSSTRRFEGSGLGLALVKEFAGMLGGTVSVSSAPGKGSVFTVECEAPEAKAAAAPVERKGRTYVQRGATPSGSSPAPGGNGGSRLPKVAIAEDNREMADYIAGLLADAATTRIAADGEEALELVRGWRPDLVLADVMMPRRDGFSLCRALKADPATTGIPVVLVTAMTNREALLKGWEAGADEYLYKPFHPRELQTRARSLLSAVRHRREAAIALARQNVELERSNQDLERFAYLASHDLQEPLRTVICYTELLQESYQGKLDAESEQAMERVIGAARRMRALITDLLEYSRVGQQGEPEACALDDVLRDVLSDLSGPIRDCAARVTSDPLPVVHAVRLEMARLFQNLLSNALKYRSEGRPLEVHVSARKGDGAWVIAFRDNGIGIPPEHVGKLFQLFQRLHPGRKYPGTGLGLALCRKIVEQRGGRIRVESEEGKGATFFMELPEPAKEEGATG